MSQLRWKRILVVGSQRILSTTAQVEECPGSWEPGNSTEHSKHSSLQSCSREGFPKETALLLQERASHQSCFTLALVLQSAAILFCLGKASSVKVTQPCSTLLLTSLASFNNGAPLREGFPSKTPVRLCSSERRYSPKPLSRDLLKEKNPGYWKPLPGWKKRS